MIGEKNNRHERASSSHDSLMRVHLPQQTKMQLEPARFGGLNTAEAAAAIVADEGALALTAGGVP